MKEEKRFTPAEFTRATDFDTAYSRLQTFAQMPIDGIGNQYQLERSVTGMSHALQTAIEFRGNNDELTHPSGQVSITQIVEAKIPNSEDTFQAYVDSEAIILSRSNAEGKKVYDMDFPLTDDFSNGDPEINADVSYMATERDQNTGIETDYAPTFQPDDPTTQQGYAKILQWSVRDLISVIEPPVTIPEDLAKAFGE